MKLFVSSVFCLLVWTINAQIGLHFDNSDDMVQTSFVGILGNNPITVEAWIKPDQASGESVITAWGSEAVNGARFTLRVNQLTATTDVIRIEIKGGGINGTIDLSDSAWHHVAVTYNPSAVSNKYKLYVDGVLDVAGDIPTPLNVLQSVNLRIGRRIHPTYTGYFGGTIDEVRVWNVARSEAEIFSNKNSEFCQIPTNLVAYYKLNEGVINGNNLAITSVIDEVAANNGSLIGFNQNATVSNWTYGCNFLGPPSSLTIQNFNECPGFTTTVNGNVYSNTGVYLDTMTSVLGCDSIIETHLTIATPVNGIDVQSACGTFQWIDGNVYNSSIDTATYNLIGQASNGCDSIVTLHLTIYQPSQGIDQHVSCGAFTWIDGISYSNSVDTVTYTFVGAASNGCDSIVTLHLTINQPSQGIDQQVSCGDFTWIDGITYSNSVDTVTFTLVGAANNGCDSIVTLHLTMNEVNVGISQAQDSLMATSNVGSYQWIDCATLLPISGATFQSFIPTQSGSYAVVVTENNCSDTSMCVNFTNAGILTHPIQFSMYPNPANELITVTSNFAGNVTIMDLLGKVIFRNYCEGTTTIRTNELNTGTYLLIFESNVKTLNELIQIYH